MDDVQESDAKWASQEAKKLKHYFEVVLLKLESTLA
ncbi:hypothetical protein SLEP1_g13998 [Rubroshorea leprosula]|uniref:Uncharacterized protein n=1 Tax=Rubroshorea leprosula TaxID=152421 RepID=A0AAV5IHL6_9ROSI|nr:hypothetical protein SLEP1_g13998 [Rubroshorea leprosula]